MLYFFRHFSALGKTTQFAVHLEFAFALGRPRERPLSKGISMALELKFQGIGVNMKGDRNSRFIHLDMSKKKSRPTIWSY